MIIFFYSANSHNICEITIALSIYGIKYRRHDSDYCYEILLYKLHTFKIGAKVIIDTILDMSWKNLMCPFVRFWRQTDC